jgi:RNA 2',3'-cyclic 3'-phosphodiesterase
MPRLFYAIDLPEEVKLELGPVVSALGKIGSWIRPVGRSAYHLTLLFLGEQQDEFVPEIIAMGAEAVVGARQCRVEIGPAGFFPRVSFLTLNGEIETLAMVSMTLCQSCRCYLEKHEDRPFKPHITVARHKQNIRPPEKEKITEMLKPFEGKSWEVRDLILFNSDLTTKGPKYTPVERFPFGG